MFSVHSVVLNKGYRKVTDNKYNQEREFLPAALEIQETPPSPIGRLITGVIILFFLTAIIWATLGKVDIIAVARGHIIPNGHSKVIQPLEIGTIRQIHVAEGDKVEQGQVLIELDAQTALADRQRLDQEIATLDDEINRLKQLESWLAQEPSQQQQEIDTGLPALQQRLLLSQWREYLARIDTLIKEQNKIEAEKAGIAQQVKKLVATLPILTRRAKNLQKLSSKKYLAEEQYLEMEQARLEMQHDLATNRKRTEELQEAIATIDSRIDQTEKEFRSQTLLQLQEAQQQRAALRQERIKAEQRVRAQTLKAPIPGVVQQLTVHTIGGVVTPAQQLMVIVPDGDNLEIEAMIENKDIGFLQEGQPAEVKIDAFPFTKYGIIDGRLTDISNDAVANENLGLIYKARVQMKSSEIQVDERRVKLNPGMTVAVEVKTGKRRVIEYFLAPLLRYRQESIRER